MLVKCSMTGAVVAEYRLHGNKYIILITSIETMDTSKLILIIDTVFHDWSTLYDQTFEATTWLVNTYF